MERITLKQVTEAYRIMRERGWSATAGRYCNKVDKKVCPVAALAYSTLKNMPHGYRLDSFDKVGCVEKKYGVSHGFVVGIIRGVDNPNQRLSDERDTRAGQELGRKCYKKFIEK